MDVTSVRLDSGMKGRMASLKDVNWAEVIRGALQERIEVEEELRRPIDRARARRAARGIDAIRNDLPPLRFDSTTEVRRWRESRK